MSWRNESYRHSLSARGVSTNRYFSRFNKSSRTVSARDGLFKRTFENPEGQKITYSRDLSRIKDFPNYYGTTPDDVAYTLDELPPETVPADVHVTSYSDFVDEKIREKKRFLEDYDRDDLLHQVRLNKDALESLSDEEFRADDVISLQEMKDMFERDLVYNQDLLQFKDMDDSQLSAHFRHKHRNLAGQHIRDDDRLHPVKVIDSNDFNDSRKTIIHEQAHAVDAGDHARGGSLREDFVKEFPVSPTFYGGRNAGENFAESVSTARIHNPDNLVFMGDTKSLLDSDVARIKRQFPASSALVIDRQARKNRAEIDDVERTFPRRAEWLSRNVPQWSGPSAREKEETAKHPRVLVAEAKVAHARDTGEYLARKRLW